MTQRPGEHLGEEPQSERGAPGSRDTGADDPSAGKHRREGAFEDESTISSGEPGWQASPDAGGHGSSSDEAAVPRTTIARGRRSPPSTCVHAPEIPTAAVRHSEAAWNTNSRPRPTKGWDRRIRRVPDVERITRQKQLTLRSSPPERRHDDS